MADLKKYMRRPETAVTAVQIDLETDGFEYQKWGGPQRAKAGDWLLNNGGDVYTVDRETFAQTYEEASPGRYIKSAPVWARKAKEDGAIATKEGETKYSEGDMIVYNNPDETDGYAMSRDKFKSLYQKAK